MAYQKADHSGNEDSEWALSRIIMPSQEGLAIAERKSKYFWFPTVATLITICVAAGTLLGGFWEFSAQQAANAHLQATQVAANAQLQATQQATNAEQALDQERQTTFDTYLDRMSDLLLIDQLQTSKPGSPVRAIAEARTLTALRDLDSFRRSQLVRFLWKAGLDTGNQPVISLSAAPLNSTMFQHALLMSINLGGALLISSTFDDCNLQEANFSGAALPGATLNNVNLTGANLTDANLYGAKLEDATLTGTNLTDAMLERANLSGDDLTQVKLMGANLAGANLKGAQITPTQLEQIASLQGAILPDGSQHP